jgi:hypothetical protein
VYPATITCEDDATEEYINDASWDRIATIMKAPARKSLSRVAAIALGGCLALLVFAPDGVRALSAPRQVSPAGAAGPIPSFEVASVRLHTSGTRPRVRVSAPPGTGRLSIAAMSVREVIQAAFGLQPFELGGSRQSHSRPADRHRG